LHGQALDRELGAESFCHTAPGRKTKLVPICIWSSVVILPLAILGVLTLFFGSFGALGARIRGDAFYCARPRMEIRDVEPGQTLHVAFVVTNATSQPLSVIRATTSCECTSLEAANLTLAPYSTTTIPVQIYTDQKAMADLFLRIDVLFDKTDKELPLTALVSFAKR
jgi:hypothetical protein